MNVQLPDGSIIEDVPDGTSKVDLLGKLQRAGHPAAPMLLKQMASEQTLGDMGGLDKFNAGMGLAFTNLGRGAKQVLGMGGGDYEENKGIDKALTSTGAGMAGNVAGNVAMLAPAAVIPGANAVAGAGAIGAITAALQPTDTTQDRLKNMAVGGGLGAGTQAAAGPIARKLGEWGADREAAALARQSQNSVRDKTLTEGLAEGLTLPASVSNPSMANKVLDSFAGKAAVGQQAAIENNAVVDRMARAEASLKPEQALSTENFKAARKAAAEPYRELTKISPQAAADMEALKEARLDAKLNWQDYARNQTPSSYKAAVKADQTADGLEAALEKHAQSIGKPELVDAMRESRVQIAKIHNVEKATNVGTGSVDSSVLGAMLDRGAPLSDGLRKIAAFQQAYKPYMREASTIPTPDVSKVGAMLSGALGAGGYAAGGLPGVAASAIPFVVPPAARKLSLSLGGSHVPDYSTGALTRGAAALDDPETVRRLSMLSRALALPAIPQVNQ